MTLTRRSSLQWLLGAATSSVVFLQRPVKGQTATGKPNCTGVVSDPGGGTVAGINVEAIDASTGWFTHAQTNPDGSYDVEAPADGHYMIVFREPQGNTQLYHVDQLTGGTSQKLFVTIDSKARSFSGLYGMLQATESLCLSIWLGPNRARTDHLSPSLLAKIPLSAMRANVALVRENLNKIEPTELERKFLTDRADAIDKLLSSLA